MRNIIYIFMIFIWSCGNQELKTGIVTKTENTLSKIVLIDTFDNELQLDTSNHITEAEFHPMFINKKSDSISLTYNTRNVKQRTIGWNINWRPDSTDLIIFVDTTRFIGSVFRSIPPPPPPPNSKEEFIWELKNYRGRFKSYPVFIENKSTDTLNIGYGEYIPLIMEAKDSLNRWRPIQEYYRYHCGTGLTNFYLPPKEILLTSCKLYKGNYKTKMRLVFGFDKTNYSNEFEGRINYKQFDELKNRSY